MLMVQTAKYISVWVFQTNDLIEGINHMGERRDKPTMGGEAASNYE